MYPMECNLFTIPLHVLFHISVKSSEIYYPMACVNSATSPEKPGALCFLARDVIYTSRAYATMTVSVCL